MQRAIDETTRRRRVQEQYNTIHGITPEGIQKKIADSRLAGSHEALPGIETEDVEIGKLSPEGMKRYVEELTDQMDLAARNLEFELAAKIRDKLTEINQVRKLQKKK
jgi:excinuclease ABC subunit B